MTDVDIAPRHCLLRPGAIENKGVFMLAYFANKMNYHAPWFSSYLSTGRQLIAHTYRGAAVVACLSLCHAASAAATEVRPAGEFFSGSVIGNPVLTGDPAVLTITLNSSPAVEPIKTVTCTGGLVLGQVPTAPANRNFIEVLGDGSRSGSVYADSQTTLSIGSCEYTGKIPMSESGNNSWSLTWDMPFASMAGTNLPTPVALARIPAGLNLIGPAGCTVTIGPNEAQTMLAEWTNATSTKPATMRFTNQELIVSASGGCSANVVHTADVSAEYALLGQSKPLEISLQ
jgi:hypothetical protein